MVEMPPYKIIDCHVHFLPFRLFKRDSIEVVKASILGAGYPIAEEDDERALQMLDDANIEKAFVISYVSPEVMGLTDGATDYVADLCARHPDRLLAFCSPDIRKSPEEVRNRMNTLIKELGVRGVKIHPCHQLLYPNEYKNEGLRSLEVIYRTAEEEGISVMFHTGTSIFPRAINRFGDPIYIDDVATDFPDLKIILAHGGRPLWMNTAFFLVRRHKNVFLDVSSIPPKALLQYFPRLEFIGDKTMFGSDWPSPGVKSIKANVESFLELPLSDETKRKVLRDNALKIMGEN